MKSSWWSPVDLKAVFLLLQKSEFAAALLKFCVFFTSWYIAKQSLFFISQNLNDFLYEGKMCYEYCYILQKQSSWTKPYVHGRITVQTIQEATCSYQWLQGIRAGANLANHLDKCLSSPEYSWGQLKWLWSIKNNESHYIVKLTKWLYLTEQAVLQFDMVRKNLQHFSGSRLLNSVILSWTW